MNWVEPYFWNWLIFAGVLALIELFTWSFFALIPAAAALIIGVVLWIFPDFSVSWQWLLFSILSLPALLFWSKLANQWRQGSKVADVINNRATALLGREFVLSHALGSEEGEMVVDDGIWRARAMRPLPVGTRVRVIGVRGNVLDIEAITPALTD